MLPKSKIQAAGLLLAVAIAGFASGSAVRGWADTKARPEHRRERRLSYTERLQRDLGLTDVQADSVRSLLAAHRPRMRATMDVIRPQLDSLRAELRAEINAVLTPAQQAALDSIVTRERAERARMDSVSNARRNRHDD